MSRKAQLEEQQAELTAKNEAVDRELQEVSTQLEPMKVMGGGGSHLFLWVHVCVHAFVHVCCVCTYVCTHTVCALLVLGTYVRTYVYIWLMLYPASCTHM